MKNKHPLIFLIGILSFVIILETLFLKTDPVRELNVFLKNDFEKVMAKYSEEDFDKVFYGNSVVISGFIDSQSKSGYTNIGIDYGTVEDLYEILDRELIDVGSELVIGLNYFTLMDTLDTNPTYPWHKEIYEPYLYFNRNRVNPVIVDGLSNVLKGEEFIQTRHESLERTVYRGVLDEKELGDKIKVQKELYWDQGIEYYDDNLKALEKVIEFAEENDIRLRCIILPWNDVIEKPDTTVLAESSAVEILQAHSVEVLDLSYATPKEYFHDLGHFNYEYGAVKFTEEIDSWLMEP
ncbi:hypothetical protein HU147_09390 [Planomicrobium chinense]|uniref:hypothetical protein n=1 Tax=Planococcus chinensis TaxID=272917 RepID=UPI001CC57371|nr:hypothetical protein [Planococcus chinensis]MBZ5201425.1 hypothetical protein [Planococcus chinensis]